MADMEEIEKQLERIEKGFNFTTDGLLKMIALALLELLRRFPKDKP